MFRAVLLDKECWIETMKLDPVTGLDPLNFKLRSAQGLIFKLSNAKVYLLEYDLFDDLFIYFIYFKGLDAADYLFPG